MEENFLPVNGTLNSHGIIPVNSQTNSYYQNYTDAYGNKLPSVSVDYGHQYNSFPYQRSPIYATSEPVYNVTVPSVYVTGVSQNFSDSSYNYYAQRDLQDINYRTASQIQSNKGYSRQQDRNSQTQREGAREESSQYFHNSYQHNYSHPASQTASRGYSRPGRFRDNNFQRGMSHMRHQDKKREVLSLAQTSFNRKSSEVCQMTDSENVADKHIPSADLRSKLDQSKRDISGEYLHKKMSANKVSSKDVAESFNVDKEDCINYLPSSRSSYRRGYNEDRRPSKKFEDNKLQYFKPDTHSSHSKKYLLNQNHQQNFVSVTSDKPTAKLRTSLNKNKDKQHFENDESQRAILSDQLSSSKYECMICCDNIRADAAVWSCTKCYHVFHLACIKKWVKSSFTKEIQTWRCPGCQNVSSQMPTQYRCFCGRRKDPKYVRGEIAHSCGEICNTSRQGDCKHPCTILCHPGPCPPCCATVWITCKCGKVRKNVRCSQSSKFECDQICGKTLNCGLHYCSASCHSGACQPCQVEKIQKCLCNKSTQKVLCGTTEYLLSDFCCQQVCGRVLDCTNHTCSEVCHAGDCKSCPLLPKNLVTCCCGQTPFSKLDFSERQSCLDPVPTCTLKCNKPLPCGSDSDPHLCDKQCHAGECGSCLKVTSLKCQCGGTEKEMSCGEAFTYKEDNPFKCLRRCGKKKTCGKHKCADTCCVKDFHICEIICGKKLSCGLHKCENLCHRGNCKKCLQASFDELTCHCGAEVLEPPVPCGAKPPECQKLCFRQHACQHPVRHNCHSDEFCPPCTDLTDKMCAGGHMMRNNVPCYMSNISCGYPCQKLLPCGQHKCPKPCHKGSCLEDGTQCTQPCQRPKPLCGHPCDAPCHTNECPGDICKAEVTVTCPCRSKTAKSQCLAGNDTALNIAQFQRLSVQSLSEHGDQGLELSQFLLAKQSHKRLDCDANCAMLERNRRLALALEIKNPDLNAKFGNPSYTEFLKDFARKNFKFTSDIEKNLNTLVQSAKQSVQLSRSHAFQSMGREQRRFVHELSEFYGCQTQSYDSEPNKNVVATAHRDKCWLPTVTLTQLITKGQTPKVPPPLSSGKSQGNNLTVLEKKKDEVPPKRAWESSALAAPADTPKVIDYFDFTG